MSLTLPSTLAFAPSASPRLPPPSASQPTPPPPVQPPPHPYEKRPALHRSSCSFIPSTSPLLLPGANHHTRRHQHRHPNHPNAARDDEDDENDENESSGFQVHAQSGGFRKGRFGFDQNKDQLRKGIDNKEKKVVNGDVMESINWKRDFIFRDRRNKKKMEEDDNNKVDLQQVPEQQKGENGVQSEEETDDKKSQDSGEQLTAFDPTLDDKMTQTQSFFTLNSGDQRMDERITDDLGSNGLVKQTKVSGELGVIESIKWKKSFIFRDRRHRQSIEEAEKAGLQQLADQQYSRDQDTGDKQVIDELDPDIQVRDEKLDESQGIDQVDGHMLPLAIDLKKMNENQVSDERENDKPLIDHQDGDMLVNDNKLNENQLVDEQYSVIQDGDQQATENQWNQQEEEEQPATALIVSNEINSSDSGNLTDNSLQQLRNMFQRQVKTAVDRNKATEEVFEQIDLLGRPPSKESREAVQSYDKVAQKIGRVEKNLMDESARMPHIDLSWLASTVDELKVELLTLRNQIQGLHKAKTDALNHLNEGKKREAEMQKIIDSQNAMLQDHDNNIQSIQEQFVRKEQLLKDSITAVKEKALAHEWELQKSAAETIKSLKKKQQELQMTLDVQATLLKEKIQRIDALEKDSEKNKVAIGELIKDNKSLRKAKQEQSNILTDNTRAIQDLEEKLSKKEAEVMDAVLEKDALREKAYEHEWKLKTIAAEEKTQFFKKEAVLKKTINGQSILLQEKMDLINELNKQLSIISAKLDDQIQQRTTLESAIKNQNVLLNESSHRIDQLNKKLEKADLDLRSVLIEKAALVDKATAEISRLKNDSVKQTSKALDNESRLQQKINRQSDELNNKVQALKQARDELAEIKSKLQEAEQEADFAKREVENAKLLRISFTDDSICPISPEYLNNLEAKSVVSKSLLGESPSASNKKAVDALLKELGLEPPPSLLKQLGLEPPSPVLTESSATFSFTSSQKLTESNLNKPSLEEPLLQQSLEKPSFQNTTFDEPSSDKPTANPTTSVSSQPASQEIPSAASSTYYAEQLEGKIPPPGSYSKHSDTTASAPFQSGENYVEHTRVTPEYSRKETYAKPYSDCYVDKLDSKIVSPAFSELSSPASTPAIPSYSEANPSVLKSLVTPSLPTKPQSPPSYEASDSLKKYIQAVSGTRYTPTAPAKQSSFVSSEPAPAASTPSRSVGYPASVDSLPPPPEDSFTPSDDDYLEDLDEKLALLGLESNVTQNCTNTSGVDLDDIESKAGTHLPSLQSDSALVSSNVSISPSTQSQQAPKLSSSPSRTSVSASNGGDYLDNLEGNSICSHPNYSSDYDFTPNYSNSSGSYLENIETKAAALLSSESILASSNMSLSPPTPSKKTPKASPTDPSVSALNDVNTLKNLAGKPVHMAPDCTSDYDCSLKYANTGSSGSFPDDIESQANAPLSSDAAPVSSNIPNPPSAPGQQTFKTSSATHSSLSASNDVDYLEILGGKPVLVAPYYTSDYDYTPKYANSSGSYLDTIESKTVASLSSDSAPVSSKISISPSTPGKQTSKAPSSPTVASLPSGSAPKSSIASFSSSTRSKVTPEASSLSTGSSVSISNGDYLENLGGKPVRVPPDYSSSYDYTPKYFNNSGSYLYLIESKAVAPLPSYSAPVSFKVSIAPSTPNPSRQTPKVSSSQSASPMVSTPNDSDYLENLGGKPVRVAPDYSKSEHDFAPKYFNSIGSYLDNLEVKIVAPFPSNSTPKLTTTAVPVSGSFAHYPTIHSNTSSASTKAKANAQDTPKSASMSTTSNGGDYLESLSRKSLRLTPDYSKSDYSRTYSNNSGSYLNNLELKVVPTMSSSKEYVATHASYPKRTDPVWDDFDPKKTTASPSNSNFTSKKPSHSTGSDTSSTTSNGVSADLRTINPSIIQDPLGYWDNESKKVNSSPSRGKSSLNQSSYITGSEKSLKESTGASADLRKINPSNIQDPLGHLNGFEPIATQDPVGIPMMRSFSSMDVSEIRKFIMDDSHWNRPALKRSPSFNYDQAESFNIDDIINNKSLLGLTVKYIQQIVCKSNFKIQSNKENVIQKLQDYFEKRQTMKDHYERMKRLRNYFEKRK